MPFCLSDFDYPLPDGLIAQHPTARRDTSRLLRLRRPGAAVSHHGFDEITGLLRRGDLIVLNDTKVIPAKFFCRRATGGKIEGLFLRESPDGRDGRWEVLLKNAARCRRGEGLLFESDRLVGLVLEQPIDQGRWIVRPEPPAQADEILGRVGITPLPPYIRRPDGDAEARDRDRYQTVYAARAGAVAAPTAGLHFTPEILDALESAGIASARVTLHVGLGTFSPVKAESLHEHRMHSEYYELSSSSAELITAAKADGRRVVAVGTTSLRVLESVAAAHGGCVVAENGWTDLFLYPPADFRVVDVLLTNFHLPRSTLLMLAAAFCRPGGTEGLAMIRDAYGEAVREEYRFFSYGDAMLIE